MSLSVCDVLLGLIPVLQAEILSRWLPMRDVVRLDSALCSTQHRESFLKILGEEYCVFNPAWNVCGKHFMWIVWRRAKISTMELTHHFDSALRLKLFQITGKSLRSLNTSLVNLDVSYRIVFEISAMCTSLERLSFSGNDLMRNNICSVLSYLPRLQYLYLTNCINLTGEMLANICAQSKCLRTLELTDSSIMEGAQTVETYPENHTIETLLFLHCGWASPFLSFVLHCKALSALYISRLQFSDVFTILAHCPALTTLSVGVKSSASKRISEVELTTLISLIQNVTALHLYRGHSFHWQETQLERLIKGAPNLLVLLAARTDKESCPSEHIKIALNNGYRFPRVYSECNNQLHTLLVDDIVSTELQCILQCCPQLQCLTIIELGAINEEGNDSIHNLMTTISDSSIRILDIPDCRCLESSAMLQLHNLVSISFNQFVHLQQHQLIVLLKQNPALKKLSLIDCQYLSQQSLLAIIEQCPGLEELVFDNTCDSTMTTTLVSGLIELLRPKLLLTLQLSPE